MSSRSSRRAPRLRLYKRTGKGRVILSGQHFYTKADFDTPEAHEEYLDLLKRWRANGMKPLREVVLPVETLHPVTVRDLAAAYEAHIDEKGLYRKNGKETSQRGMLRAAVAELVQSSGDVPLRVFSRPHLVRHRDTLQGKAGLTRQGVNRKIGMLRRIVRWGAERAMVPDQNLFAIEAIRPLHAPPPKRRECVPQEDLDAILPKLSSTLRAMVSLQRLTGMRPGEVCAMRWRDIDKHPEEVDPKLKLWRYTVAAPKAEHHGTETVYLLNDACQSILKRFVKTPAAFLFTPRDTIRQRWPGGAEGLLDVASGRYTAASYRQAIERACEAAKVQRFTPHQIRHAFITMVANDPSLGLAAASEAANHRSQQTTLNYVHRDRKLAVRVALAMRTGPTGTSA